MEKISVLVPIYNAEKYIEKCLDSIVNQTYANIEIVLIEDGSTDNSLEIIKEYSKQDKRIKIKNFVQDPVFCAFGRNENPDYKDYEEFLESRCFPRTRDKMKIMLEELNLPFYDPFLIVQKTEGRMAEDDFWIQIEE